jgi:hypothetical protein
MKYWSRNYRTGPIAERVARMIVGCGNVEYTSTPATYMKQPSPAGKVESV